MAEDDKKDPPATDGKPDGDGMTTDAGKAALQKERERVKALEQQVKDLKPLADAAKKAEDEKLGEVERLTKQLTEANGKADAATADATRWKVALDKGLTLAQAKRLSGANEAELTADADAYREEHGLDKSAGDSKSKPAGGKPSEALKGGGDPDQDPPVDIGKVVDSIPRGF